MPALGLDGTGVETPEAADELSVIEAAERRDWVNELEGSEGELALDEDEDEGVEVSTSGMPSESDDADDDSDVRLDPEGASAMAENREA